MFRTRDEIAGDAVTLVCAFALGVVVMDLASDYQADGRLRAAEAVAQEAVDAGERAQRMARHALGRAAACYRQLEEEHAERPLRRRADHE